MNVCPGEGVAYDSYYNETDRVTSVHDNQCLRIAHINIQGLKSKMEDIRNDSDLLKADILCLNETRLDKYDKLDNTNPFGDERKIIRCDRNQNGGVMIALSNKYRVAKQLLFGHPILEIVGIQICVPDPLNIICVYRPPGYNKTKFISDLTNILNDVHSVPHNSNLLISNYCLFRRPPSTPKITPLTQC